VIDRYLGELRAALGVRGRLRQRVLEEAEGHLREAVEGGIAEGLTPLDAESKAVAKFGPAGLVAERFAAELASDRTRRAIAATGASLAAFSLFFQLSTQTGALRDGSPLLAGPYEPVAWLGVQVAIAVGALTGCDGGGTGATR